jgi:ABC-2 type transport system ATP-binding protein
MLSGLMESDDGELLLIDAGADVVWRWVAQSGQDRGGFYSFDLLENLSFFGQLYGLSGHELRKQIDRTLDLVNLASRARDAVGTYSGGMQRRLNIAAGILHEPKLVLMDEPTVGLDPQSRRNILDLVQSLALTGTAIVYSTHYMDEVEQICDRVGIIDRGAVLVEGTVDELRQSLGGRELVSAARRVSTGAGAARLRRHRRCRGGQGDRRRGAAERRRRGVAAAGAARHRQPARRNPRSAGHRPTLETLFLKLTGRELRE